MYIRTLLLLIAIIIHVSAGGADIYRMAFSGKTVSSADGLSSNTVYDMVQDNDGFMWMGASYGLCRYDGYSFVNYYSLGSERTRKIDATPGNLYHDSRNGLLWVHTSTFTFACYDLKKGRFADYTGRGDEHRSYRRFLLSGDDMWMYDTRSGIRHVSYKNGVFACTDYTKSGGRLPSDTIARLVEDGRHNIWAFTSSGLLRIDSTGKVHTVVAGRKYIMGNEYHGNVLCLSEDNTVEMFAPDGRLLRSVVIPPALGNVRTIRSNFVWRDKWMVFSGETYCVDLNTWECSKPQQYQVANGLLLDSADGFFFESNSSGKLWIFAPDGSVRMLSLLPDMKFTAERQRKYNVRRGHDGLFYIASYGNGLFIYDHTTGAIRHLSASDEQAVIGSNYLTGLFVDRRGNIWASQESAGVSCISVTEQPVADIIMPAPGHKGDWANYVMMTAMKPDGSIVMSTRDNKMYTMDALTLTPGTPTETKACAYAYMTDTDGHEWIATRGAGLYVDGRRYSKHDAGRHIPTNDFYDIWQDGYGRVWLASYENGIVVTEYEADGNLRFLNLLTRSINESRLHKFEPGPDGWLWIASSNGLYAVDTKRQNITNDDFLCFNTANGRFPFDEMRTIRYAGGYLWAGGKGSGVVRCKFDKNMAITECTALTTGKGLADNNVCSILDDRFGNIWVATTNGLSRIYDRDMKVKTFMFGNMPERNDYSDNCALRLADGRLLFGTCHGLTLITPRQRYESDSRRPAEVCVTDILVNGRSVSADSVLNQAVSLISEIVLGHNENTISLSFSNFEYDDINSSLYQYYLEGSDRTWRPVTSINHVEYNNLPSGKYIFHIRALSNNKWSPERDVTIIIRRPWYSTWPAWFIYAALSMMFGLYIYTNARERLRLHQQMKLEKQLTEFRLNFFTSITHEFRTPLAIIQGAVDKLNNDRSSRAALQTARRGTRRLLRLVDMLMEFRRVNTGNIRLQVERDDIIGFVRNIYQDFWSIARRKDMRTVFTPFAKRYDVEFDHRMVETIVYNLMSNAIKYAPEHGMATLSVRLDGDSIVIAVEDDGPGISDEQQASLFQPFMQGHVSQGGMGIGLYVAHSMAVLHHGTMTYRRKPEGGSVFTVMLPADGNAYSDADRKRGMAVDTSVGQRHDDGCEDIIRELRPEALNDTRIAIIEDDPDMMEQISCETGRYFRTDCYTTGLAALTGIAERMPALVICDVMLPDMSGYDIVKQLKSADVTAVIPVIMLTALDDENHQLRSYNAGADDYMVKPCNFRLLIGRAVQLIRQARAVNSSSVSSAFSSTSSDVSSGTSPSDCCPVDVRSDGQYGVKTCILTSPADKNFIDRVATIVAQHVADPDFTVDVLAAQMGIGRTKVFSKMKELIGMSPNKYLQNERMRIAADLLAEGNLTVSEVSYRVGIKDASYFNKCFKAKYGVVPSKYSGNKEQLNQEENIHENKDKPQDKNNGI